LEDMVMQEAKGGMQNAIDRQPGENHE